MITGIVAEFNPFHNGHKYLLDQIEGLKIVVMSGNFMQRGEPAIVDKWTRAQMALENGADIVVELPFLAAVQSADYFAKGAIEILAKMGVTQLAFGTEDVLDYDAIGQVYCQKQAEMLAFLDSLPEDLSYPQKTQLMWENFTGLSFTGQTPNHILALAYTKAAAPRGIRLQPIQRQGAGFHSEQKDRLFSSATAIRKHIDDEVFVEQASPVADLLKSSPQVSWENYFSYLKYQVLSHTDLTSIYQVNEEMASRLKSVIREVSSVEELVEKVSTKRYTKARVRRLLTYILVNVRENELPESVHVLGFNQKGQNYLSTIKKEVSLVTRIGSDPWDDITQKADQIYQLGHPNLADQTWGRVPIRKIE